MSYIEWQKKNMMIGAVSGEKGLAYVAFKDGDGLCWGEDIIGLVYCLIDKKEKDFIIELINSDKLCPEMIESLKEQLNEEKDFEAVEFLNSLQV